MYGVSRKSLDAECRDYASRGPGIGTGIPADHDSYRAMSRRHALLLRVEAKRAGVDMASTSFSELDERQAVYARAKRACGCLDCVEGGVPRASADLIRDLVHRNLWRPNIGGIEV